MHNTQYQDEKLFAGFSSRNIISQNVYVDTDEDELGISYGIIIRWNLMSHLGMLSDFLENFSVTEQRCGKYEIFKTKA